LVPVPRTWRATSVQACGWWPFAAGNAAPAVGVPVGHDLHTGAVVRCDPISWFRAGLISSPSMFVLGMPGMGKSSFTVRQILGAADAGITPLVAGDLKPDYTRLIEALGGQVIAFGDGQHLNPLDQAGMLHAADRLGGPRGEQLREQAIGRAAGVVAALLQVTRRARLADWEHTLLTRAIRDLTTSHREKKLPTPTLPDLAALLQAPTDGMVAAILAENEAAYRAGTRPLNRSVQALLDGPLGRTFAGASTHRWDPAAPGVCVDISAIARQGEELLAAVMVACWSETFATVEAANALADAGAAPQRHFLTVMDEMWRPLRLTGAGLIDRLDALTRLNRSEGVGHIFITHSLKDLESTDSPADAAKARGFVERSAITVLAGLAPDDLAAVSAIRRLSPAEISTVASWSTPPTWPTVTDIRDRPAVPAVPAGAGKVLLKVGQRPGIATQILLTETELHLHDTNHRWARTPGRDPLPEIANLAAGPNPADREPTLPTGPKKPPTKRRLSVVPAPRAAQHDVIVRHRDGVSARWGGARSPPPPGATKPCSSPAAPDCSPWAPGSPGQRCRHRHTSMATRSRQHPRHWYAPSPITGCTGTRPPPSSAHSSWPP
jgi:hypothetical protein